MSDSVSLAYSPCPNDTYIFAALANGLIGDAPRVRVVLDDVQALNEAARLGTYELTKVSYGAIPYLMDKYRILRAGGAIGRGCGPLLIAKPDVSDAPKNLYALRRHARIAIPGSLTTAYILLRMALGYTPETVEMRFDTIVDAVAGGEVDAGVIIHESRFTYARRGLLAYADLGAWWEETTGKPIPLGAILIRRDVGEAAAARYDSAIAQSLEFARAQEDRIMPYVREHAAEMEDPIMRKHIETYVNDFSTDVGDEGIAAVDEFFARAAQAQLIPAGVRADFV